MENLEEKFGWSSLGKGLFILPCGNIVIDPVVENSNIFYGFQKCDVKQAKLLGKTWRECIINSQNHSIRELMINLKIRFNIDTNDSSKSLKLSISPDTQDGKAIYMKGNKIGSYSANVKPQKDHVEYVYDALRYGKKIFRLDDLKKLEISLKETIDDMNSIKDKNEADGEQFNELRFNNEYENIVKQYNEIVNEINFILKI